MCSSLNAPWDSFHSHSQFPEKQVERPALSLPSVACLCFCRWEWKGFRGYPLLWEAFAVFLRQRDDAVADTASLPPRAVHPTRVGKLKKYIFQRHSTKWRLWLPSHVTLSSHAMSSRQPRRQPPRVYLDSVIYGDMLDCSVSYNHRHHLSPSLFFEHAFWQCAFRALLPPSTYCLTAFLPFRLASCDSKRSKAYWPQNSTLKSYPHIPCVPFSPFSLSNSD